jgi:aminoglycoside 6'-N-acetyltransferase
VARGAWFVAELVLGRNDTERSSEPFATIRWKMDPIHGDLVTLRPTAPADRAALKAIRDEPEVIRWWDAQTDGWPGDDETVEEWTIEHDGEVVGFIQFSEEPDADYRHADVDILLTTHVHSRGLGTDAMRAITRHLIEQRGHHRITLSTSPHNARAIRSYEKAGFRRVGVARLSERGADGAWHDELLMELVVKPRAESARRPRGRARSRPHP